ncbi:MAG: hypothetical protein WHW07_01910 [Bacteroidales bacterium]
MRTTKHILFIVSAAIFLFSCTPQKRLSRLIALHPELKTTDTIRIQDTTIIPATRIDTSFHESKLNDTVIIIKEKLKLKLHRIHDTIYVEAEREADTVVVKKEVVVERVVLQQNSQSSIYKFWTENKYYILLSVFCLAVMLGVVVGGRS